MKKALYRTMRPLRFSEVRDQDLIVAVLKNQVETGSVSHGYLFCGSRGTGKTTCAKILSRAVNCLHPEHGEPCNACANCLEILEDRSVDVLELDAASNNGVDHVRELKTLGVYPPSTLRRKVYIIDEAHMLSTSAFNALLKILEEPPEHLMFILATTDPDKLPDTVRSRLQRFDFHAISPEAIVAALRDAAEAMGESVEPGVLHLIGDHAKGAMRDALSLLDQLMALPDRPITRKAAIDLLGVTSAEEVVDMLAPLAERKAAEACGAAAEALAKGKSPERLLYALLEGAKICFMIAAGAEDAASLQARGLEAYLKVGRDHPPERFVELMRGLTDVLGDMHYAYDPSLLLEAGVAVLAQGDAKSAIPCGPVEGHAAPSERAPTEARACEVRPSPAHSPVEEVSEGGASRREGKASAVRAPDVPEKVGSGQDLTESDDASADARGRAGALEAEGFVPEERITDAGDLQQVEEVLAENEEGRRFLAEIAAENPLISSIADEYAAHWKDGVLTFTRREPEAAESVLANYRDDLLAHVREKTGRDDVIIVIQDSDPCIDRMRQDFGSLFHISGKDG